MKGKSSTSIYACAFAVFLSWEAAAQTDAPNPNPTLESQDPFPKKRPIALYFSGRVSGSWLLGDFSLDRQDARVYKNISTFGVGGEFQAGVRLEETSTIFGGMGFSSDAYRVTLIYRYFDSYGFPTTYLSSSDGMQNQTTLFGGIRREFILGKRHKAYLEGAFGAAYMFDKLQTLLTLSGTKYSISTGYILNQRVNFGVRYSYSRYAPAS